MFLILFFISLLVIAAIIAPGSGRRRHQNTDIHYSKDYMNNPIVNKLNQIDRKD